MLYFQPMQAPGNVVVSVDRVRVRYEFLKAKVSGEWISVGVDDVAAAVKRISAKWQLDTWEKAAVLPAPSTGKYKWCFQLPAGASSAVLFLGQYAGAELLSIAELEFNPNKALGDPRGNLSEPLRDLLRWLWEHQDANTGVVFKRFDLAADFYGVPRGCVFSTVKDARMPETKGRGETRTASWGPRSARGRLKVYNKAVESHLDENCTRIELTASQEDIEDKEKLKRLWGVHSALKQPPDDFPMVIQLLFKCMEYDPDFATMQLECCAPNTRKKYENLLRTGSRALDLPLFSSDGESLEEWLSRTLYAAIIPDMS